MPRHARATKTARDTRTIGGLQKHGVAFDAVWGSKLKSADAMAARFKAHLEALDRVTARYAAWRLAVDDELQLEKEVKALHALVGRAVRAHWGDDREVLHDFGLAPRKKAKIGVAQMQLMIARRKATRKARGTMGKKQKKAIKGWR